MRKLSSRLATICWNLFIGTEKVSVSLVTKGRALMSKKPE